MQQGNVLITVEKVSLNFGGIQAINNVSLNVKDGEILAIIGPNGAGKTSLLNCINGFYRPTSGHIYYAGKDITRLARHKVSTIGISRTFQNIQLYTGLSAIGNLMAARHIFMKQNFINGGLYFGSAHHEEIRHREMVEDIIEFLDLEAVRNRIVGTLPYGQRKKIDLGRALALEPKILLLDEPMAGMNSEEKEDMARYIIDAHELKKIAIVMVEHDMGVVMDIADRVTVLDFGCKIAEGMPNEIMNHPKVIEAYLGKEKVMKVSQ